MHRSKLIPMILSAVFLTLGYSCSASNETEKNEFTNLQVLPKNITDDELSKVMLTNMAGLGLPRRQSRGCLYCHAGNMDIPRDEWDMASDEKPTKQKARVMMRMMASINKVYLANLNDRIAPSLEVSCATCHAGRTDPRPMPDVLWSAYNSSGIDSTIIKYHELREIFFGGNAYDFRMEVLTNFAFGLAGRGQYDEAEQIASVNAEVYPDEYDPYGVGILLRLEGMTKEIDVGTALSEIDFIVANQAREPLQDWVVDFVGWRLHRTGHEEDALLLFKKNLTLFPDSYTTTDSHASAIWAAGDKNAAIAEMEAWVQANPDHDEGRRRLANLKSRLNK